MTHTFTHANCPVCASTFGPNPATSGARYLVDMGMATDDQVAALEVVPTPSRWRRFRWRLWEYRDRLHVALDALRGRHDCNETEG